VVPDKAERVYNFHHHTLHALQELVQAAGLHHPGEIDAHHIMRRVTDTEVKPLSDLVLRLTPGVLQDATAGDLPDVFRTYWPTARAERFAP